MKKPLLKNFNPRFPRGKRLKAARVNAGLTQISIHASRGGSDYFYKRRMNHA